MSVIGSSIDLVRWKVDDGRWWGQGGGTIIQWPLFRCSVGLESDFGVPNPRPELSRVRVQPFSERLYEIEVQTRQQPTDLTS